VCVGVGVCVCVCVCVCKFDICFFFYVWFVVFAWVCQCACQSTNACGCDSDCLLFELILLNLFACVYACVNTCVCFCSVVAYVCLCLSLTVYWLDCVCERIVGACTRSFVWSCVKVYVIRILTRVSVSFASRCAFVCLCVVCVSITTFHNCLSLCISSCMLV
jgi:hypothetical protein